LVGVGDALLGPEGEGEEGEEEGEEENKFRHF
jgi:hypothetical protein